MIVKNKVLETEVERHLTHTISITSYYDGKKIGEKFYHLKSGDEINVKMTKPIIEVKME
jgi:hypothetical protein